MTAKSQLTVNDPIKLLLSNISPSITVELIYKVIEDQNIGKIDNIFIQTINSEKKEYEIEFKYWNPLNYGAHIRQSLQNNGKVFFDSKINIKGKGEELWICSNKNYIKKVKQNKQNNPIRKKNPYKTTRAINKLIKKR